MVVGEASINNIMGGIENTGSVRLHNHKRKLKQRFDIIKKLGQGTYGKVQLGINKETGQEVAIKTIKKSKIETEADLIRIRREIQIMSSVQHPNIIHIYEVFENREKMVLVMEYAAGGELYDYLSERKVLIEEEARRIFRQISTACYYCHKHKICHRDLKLENILLDENRNAKIADFGLSNVFDDQRLLSTFCGSPLYASPEIVKGTPYHGPEVDCWSIGVLLYTLVYGAMPFDGSNFKRLVKQISQGDYFEPKNPSPASPLIQEMLTVNPKNRANIEKICAHWWVNEGYDDSCLEISEELANQTPVRLDVLLSLNPPPSQLESDKLVVTGELQTKDDQVNAEQAAPTRSQSVGSLMDVTNPAERRIQELIAQELKATPKRKLETTVSTDQANVSADVKRKDKISKENTVADISMRGRENKMDEGDVKMTEISNNNGAEAQDLSLQGAACAELLEEAKKSEVKKPQKVKKTMSTNVGAKILEEINENPSQESLYNRTPQEAGKENVAVVAPQSAAKPEAKEEKEVKTPTKKKIVKKKVLTEKNEVAKPVVEAEKKEETEVQETKDDVAAEPPSKPVERRQSRIFEQAEKFQSLISSGDLSKVQPVEKPKKIVIPGVSVGGFKKEFERKASLKSVSPPKLKTTASKKHIIEDKPSSPETEAKVAAKTEVAEQPTAKTDPPKVERQPEVKDEPKPEVAGPVVAPPPEVDDRQLKLKNAVSIISNALDKEGTRKSKSRPCMTRKPPVPFGASGRSASGSIAMISSPISPPSDNKRFPKMQTPIDTRTLPLRSTPERVVNQPEPTLPENKTSSAEITLKSATLPRRKSTKAEIQLEYPKPKPATMEFKTEMAHQVQGPPTLATQRSEVMFPVNLPSHNIGLRSVSLEPESRVNQKERIIPIAFEATSEANKETPQSAPTKPPVPRTFSTQKSTQRSNSLSRQSTQESDSETTVSGDPIKKSPREYIIPIAVEGGGYVTPRAGSLEPSESSRTVTNSSRKTTGSKFSRPRRMMSFFDRDGSEDESPFGTLHRHSSFGKDSDNESDSRKDAFHMHRLRSSRPRKSTLEHNDSLSSGEDDDDDDGFEFLTAENLFSTLLSRVRDLTHRINDDGSRPGFPNSRLLSHFDHGTNFWNRMEPLGSHNSPLGRQFSRERSVNSSSSIPWRRSVSRDLATDIESVFNDPKRAPSPSAIVPRGDDTDRKDTLNLSDLNLRKLKLTEEDALALSYLTPGLSRRIQKQLFASLPPSEARKISRTLSMRDENEKHDATLQRRSVDRISATLPRKFSFDKCSSSQQNLTCDINQNNFKDRETNNINSRTENGKSERSYLPTKPRDSVYSPYADKSSRAETYDVKRPDYSLENTRPKSKYTRSTSLREPADYRMKSHTYSLRSPDSSLSEMSSLRDDDSSYSYGPETTSLSKYMHPSHLLENTKSLENQKSDGKTVRKISRFLRPDFYDARKEENIVVKEKKEREMETQKVLKEIRDKRIKNRLTMRRERSLSREKSLEKEIIKTQTNTDDHLIDIRNNNNIKEPTQSNGEKAQIVKCKDLVQALTTGENKPSVIDNSSVHKDTDTILKNVSDNIKNIESNVLSNAQNTTKKDRISKLVRPKSYPAENGFKDDKEPKIKPAEPKPKPTKLKKTPATQKSQKDVEKPSTKNKFLHSIEKKIEKLRTLSTDDKSKEEKKSGGVESAIKRLRDQSVPRNVDHITESTLIKRAVSVEDFSNVKQKSLQPSRKSVTKILSLFKKYEDKDKPTTDDEAKNGDPLAMLTNINESNIPTVTKLSPERVVEKERPKSLYFDKVKRYGGTRLDNGDAKQKTVSKLPVNSYRKSMAVGGDDNGNNSVNDNEVKVDRKNLKLDFSNINEDVNLNRVSYTTDESSNLLSPCDETLSCDSWSVCSDFHHTQDLLSPVSPNGNLYNSGDDNESVIDRIRRKSFYTRFNEKKKPRKSLIGNYKDLDLYKDYSQKSLPRAKATPNEYSSPSYRRNSGYSSSCEGEHEYRPYVRSKSVANDYVNVPNRYQTYNPRRGNISSLYSSMSEDGPAEDVSTAGLYKKYSYNPNASRLGSLSRTCRSPSSDFQYVPRPHRSNSGHSSVTSPTENGQPITEHAV